MAQDNDRGERRAKLAAQLKEWRASAFVVTALPNIRYLTGFTGSNAMLLLTSDRSLLLTDPRYQTQSQAEADCEVRISKRALAKELGALVGRMRLKSVAVEQNRISFHEFSYLQSALPKVKLRPVANAVEKLREIKTETEIATIRTAVQLNSEALQQTLRAFQPQMTEVDVAAEIEYRMRRLGADGTAFDTIVASGPRTALPHAHPTDGPVQSDQLLLIDMGARVAGYCSDMTRVYAIGKLRSKARRIYRAVLEAQLAALDAVKPGATCNGVDRAARLVLRSYGLDQAFIHSTGHGLGLEIHEGPRVGRKDKTKLQPGMVITIEPGAYVEELGGVRIEDTVLVTESGCEVLTPTSKEWTAL